MPRFLDPKAIEETIAEISEMARRENTKLALIGGVAMEIYGSDRMTKDVDFAALNNLSELTIVKPLSFGGYAGISKKGHPVDVVVRNDEYAPLYAETIETATDVGLPVLVADPEHLASLKMAAGRDKDEIDLKTLLRLNVLDLPKTRSIVKKYLGEYAARALDSLCDEVSWLKARER